MLTALGLFVEDEEELYQVCHPRRSDNYQLSGPESQGEAGKVEVRFRGFKRDHCRKGATLVILDPSRWERGAVEWLTESLLLSDGAYELPQNLTLLMADVLGAERKVWARGQATQCLSSGVAKVAPKMENDGKRCSSRDNTRRICVAFGGDWGCNGTDWRLGPLNN